MYIRVYYYNQKCFCKTLISIIICIRVFTGLVPMVLFAQCKPIDLYIYLQVNYTVHYKSAKLRHIREFLNNVRVNVRVYSILY